jgi:hypothetical protein
METTKPSPDGRYIVALVAEEMRMSHWLDLPILSEAAGKRRLLDLSDSMWSADSVVWRDDSRRVSLEMRRYPGDAPGVSVEIDVQTWMSRVRTPSAFTALPVTDLPDWLERWYASHRRDTDQPA